MRDTREDALGRGGEEPLIPEAEATPDLVLGVWGKPRDDGVGPGSSAWLARVEPRVRGTLVVIEHDCRLMSPQVPLDNRLTQVKFLSSKDLSARSQAL